MMKTLAIAALAALTLGAAAATVTASPAQAQLQLRAVTPQPGDCKASQIVAQGPNAPAAQALWANQAATAYGANWAMWAAAKDKSVVPVARNGAVWKAMARPCFYLPVP